MRALRAFTWPLRGFLYEFCAASLQAFSLLLYSAIPIACPAGLHQPYLAEPTTSPFKAKTGGRVNCAGAPRARDWRGCEASRGAAAHGLPEGSPPDNRNKGATMRRAVRPGIAGRAFARVLLAAAGAIAQPRKARSGRGRPDAPKFPCKKSGCPACA
jgi:hypothetical protein